MLLRKLMTKENDVSIKCQQYELFDYVDIKYENEKYLLTKYYNKCFKNMNIAHDVITIDNQLKENLMHNFEMVSKNDVNKLMSFFKLSETTDVSYETEEIKYYVLQDQYNFTQNNDDVYVYYDTKNKQVVLTVNNVNLTPTKLFNYYYDVDINTKGTYIFSLISKTIMKLHTPEYTNFISYKTTINKYVVASRIYNVCLFLAIGYMCIKKFS